MSSSSRPTSLAERRPRPSRRLRLCVLSCVALGCAPDIAPLLRPPKTRARLFRDAPSYGSPEDTLRYLGLARAPMSEKRHRGHSKGCLSRSFRYEVRILTVPAADRGFAGPLALTFLDGKLVRTSFRPYRGEAYVAALLEATSLVAPGASKGSPPPGPSRRRPASPRRVHLSGAPPHTRVEVIRRREGLEVVWSDTRLLKAYWEVQARGSSRYME